MQKAKRVQQAMVFLVLCCLVVVFMIPIVFVVMNSFKGKLYISDNPFVLPIGDLCVGFENYMEGIEKTNFFAAFGWTTFITIFSVLAIILFTSMTAWYITRVKTKSSEVLYYAFVFSMVVPSR